MRSRTSRPSFSGSRSAIRGIDREIYAGPRDTAPLAFREVRRTRMSPWLFVQVRKTF